ncbi:uncharacterized protein LOC144109797 [Amblyomma americanum]
MVTGEGSLAYEFRSQDSDCPDDSDEQLSWSPKGKGLTQSPPQKLQPEENFRSPSASDGKDHSMVDCKGGAKSGVGQLTKKSARKNHCSDGVRAAVVTTGISLVSSGRGGHSSVLRFQGFFGVPSTPNLALKPNPNREDWEAALPGCSDLVYKSRFDTYVDVPEGHTFSDGDKINLVGSSSSDEQNLPLETGTDDGPLVLAPSCSEPDKRLFTVQQPLYELPPIPLDIKADIEGTALGEVSSRTKNRIVSWITAHLLTIDWYPGKFYEPAAKALVLKYPVLRDTIGTGYDSWRVAFKYKMGNIRKSVDNDPNVEEARKKFGRKGNFQDKSGLKKQCRVPRDTLETTVEEVDGVVAAHVDFMAKEMKRCNPDIQKLKVSMQTTLPSRRKWIKINSPSTEELLDKYPALTLREMVSET